jgi:hypothetical protein
MSELLRISGKNLGAFTMPDACPRCLWLQLHCKFRLPFAKFPGIFSSIDRYTKSVTDEWWNKHGRPPAWLKEFGDIQSPLPAPHHSKFFVVEPTSNVMLTGDPDAMFRKTDGTLLILDFKTAKFTEGQDALLPIYRTQLTAYSHIAEQLGMGRVSDIALVYFEPLTSVSTESVDSVATTDGFSMGFSATVLPLELNQGNIPLLLHKVRKIYDRKTAPKGRSGCKDCRLLDNLVEMAA